MEIKFSTEGNFAIWEYERLSVVGARGKLEEPLYTASRLYHFGLEFAPVQKQPKRDFLAGFCFLPAPIDVTLVRTEEKDASIVTYSLDKDESVELIDRLSERLGFYPCSPDDGFTNMIGSEIAVVETITYDQCQKISRMLGVDLEKAFGAVRYTNFLNNYRGLSPVEAMAKAAETFGLPKDKLGLP